MKIISFDNSKKGITKNALLAFLFQFIIKFKGVIILPLIVYYLPVEVLGEWRLISASIAIILPIISLNILDGSGMFFSADLDKKSVRIKYYTVLHFTLLLTSFFCIISLFFKSIFKIFDDYTLLLIVYFISAVFLKLSVFLFQTYQKSQQLLIINLIVEYGSALFTLILIFLGIKNLNTIIMPIIILNFLVSASLLPKIFREINYSFYLDSSFIKKVLPVSIPLIPVFVTEWILGSIGIYFLQYHYSTEIVGSYSVLLSIASLLLTLRATLQFFWFSTCSNMLQSNKKTEFQSILSVTLKVYFIFCLLALIIYNFFGEDLIIILANPSFNGIITPLYFTSIGYIFLIFSTIWNGILYATGKSKLIFKSYIITALLVVFFNYIMVEKYEIMGASLAYMLGNIILFFLMFNSAKDVKISFTDKDKTINIIMLFAVLIISSSRFFPIDCFYNRIIGAALLILFPLLFVFTKYIKTLQIIKLFKKE